MNSGASDADGVRTSGRRFDQQSGRNRNQTVAFPEIRKVIIRMEFLATSQHTTRNARRVSRVSNPSQEDGHYGNVGNPTRARSARRSSHALANAGLGARDV